ncbi:MAG TPA: hypothetical protein VMV77_14035, partial [Bacteroidales bacterium]|nr:hypothetical protein [Bacteroidales bacterium]
MKKLILISLFVIAGISLANGQFTKIGGGLTFGTGFQFNNTTEPENEKLLYRGPFAGIYLSGIYELNLPIHLAPSFTYLIPRTNEVTEVNGFSQKTRVSAMMFDFNGHYVFNSLVSVHNVPILLITGRFFVALGDLWQQKPSFSKKETNLLLISRSNLL